MNTRAAIAKAADEGLDLVLVAADATPPVAKILDLGKMKYEQSKKGGNNAKAPKTKEMKLRPGIQENDLQTKVRQMQGFLDHGDKVQLSIEFKGRQMAHQSEGTQVMEKVLALLAPHGTPESKPKMNGKSFGCVVAPLKKTAE